MITNTERFFVGASVNLRTWPSRQEGQWWSKSGDIIGVLTPLDATTGRFLSLIRISHPGAVFVMLTRGNWVKLMM